MTIPASLIVNAIPGVLSAGGSGLVMNGLFLTENLQQQTGTVNGYPTAAAVGAYFGLSSAEYAAALIYFAGFNNSTVKPGNMLFAPYNLTARAGWLQGGSLAGITLATLQTYTGTLTITFAGSALTSSSINLSAATSFSNAATIILAAFTSPPFTVSYSSTASAFVFTSTATGATETIIYATGSLAAELALTQATGAILSQGAALDTPSSAMANAVAVNQNWASMVPLFEPTLSNKELFAVWFGSQNNRYLYLGWDSDTQASVAGSTECFGYVAQQNGYTATAALSGDPAQATALGTTLAALALNEAIFTAGLIASINFNATAGRTNTAFQSSPAGISPSCASLTTATNLLNNGYNFYGSFATANQGFTFLYNGQMFGPFLSITRYVNQIYMLNQAQLALMNLVTSVGSVGYNPAYYTMIRNALVGGFINQAVNFGAIRTNVSLSALQVSEVNQAAGVNCASQISSIGWYLQILDPGATARSQGKTPIINFFYTDGGDILQFSLAAIDIL